MPEFILDYGSPESAKQFRALDAFTQGYIEAMFFTDCEHNTVRPDDESDSDNCNVWNPEKHSSLPGDVSFADLAPKTLARIAADCSAFQEAHPDTLAAASELVPGSEEFRYARDVLDDTRLGQLFWYARCGHGVAFTDDGDAQCLQDLQEAAQRVGNVGSYLGDDGLIYLA